MAQEPDYDRFKAEMKTANRELDEAIECKDDPKRKAELIMHLENVRDAFNRLLDK